MRSRREPCARSSGNSLRRFATLEEARSGLEALLRDGDVVLLKGSRAAGLDELVRHLQGSAEEPALA